MHFNYRYFETDEWRGVPGQWWFGGGTDITPSYLYTEDMEHFHGAYKAVCDAHDPAFYPKFKSWCDDYFLIKHRGERRGLGGIFFDDLNDRAPEELLKFSTQAMNSVVDSYLPIVARRKDAAFTEEQRQWQQLRRGRCVLVLVLGWLGIGASYFQCFLIYRSALDLLPFISHSQHRILNTALTHPPPTLSTPPPHPPPTL